MKRIYRVEFEEKWTGSSEWTNSNVNVFANGGAEVAAAKAKRYAFRQNYEDSDTGKLQKCVGFRMTEVKILAEASI